MTNALSWHILAISLLTCVTVTIPGALLTLRGIALMSDAISHAVLPGIVLAFLFIGKLSSGFLFIGALLMSVAMVVCTQYLIDRGRLPSDAAVALAFPPFFALGIVLVNYYAADIHLDNDAVLLGEVCLAPFNRLYIAEIDLGPVAFWLLATVLLINLLFCCCFFKEVLVTTFDKAFARSLGFSSATIHYLLMVVASITIVAAFEVVGSLVVIALMITPAATASLIAHRVVDLLCLSVVISIASAITGYLIALYTDTCVPGAIAFSAGALFLVTFLLTRPRPFKTTH